MESGLISVKRFRPKPRKAAEPSLAHEAAALTRQAAEVTGLDRTVLMELHRLRLEEAARKRPRRRRKPARAPEETES